jgi:hypothetical protein
MTKRTLLFYFWLFALTATAQPFIPVGKYTGAIIGHSDNKDYFVRATVKKLQNDLYRAEFNIINSNYSGDFVSDMKLANNRLSIINFQIVKEYPKPYPHIRDCFTGYFELMMLGKDSVRVLDLHREPVFHSTQNYMLDSLTGNMIPSFECFNFIVLHTKIKDTTLQMKEKRTDSLLTIKKSKTDISSKRTTVTGKQFQTSSDSLTISVWDNNQIDGDSISLKLNDDWILTNQLLKRDKLVMKIPVTGKQSELLLLAENLGATPPNTAAITLQDATTTKTFYLQSDFKKSEVLKIIKLPK